MRKNRERTILGFDGSLMRMGEKLFDLLALGFLWLLCSLPLITVGASTAALYYAVVKCVKKENGYPVKAFFHSFRLNLLPGTLLWLLVAAVNFLMHLNIGILAAETDGYAGLFLICFYALAAVFVLAVSCYLFPALSRFAMSGGWLLKLSMYMAVRYFGTTAALLLTLFCAGALVLRIPMLVFFLPGPVVFLASDFLERVLKKHEPETKEQVSKAAETD